MSNGQAESSSSSWDHNQLYHVPYVSFYIISSICNYKCKHLDLVYYNS